MNVSTDLAKTSACLITAALLLIAPFLANAAIYLHIQDLVGDVTAQGYEGWIELDSVQEGISISSTIGTGGSRTTSAPSFAEITATKALDKTSPFLRQQLVSTKAIPSVTIVLVRTGSGALEEYFRIELTNAVLTSVSMSSGANTVPNETLSLNFEKITWQFRPFDQAGNPGAVIPAGYDLTTNQKI